MKNLQEKKLHGQPDFPFAVYPGRLPEFGTGYPLHWHEEMELIHIQSGTGCISVQGERFTVSQGDLVVIPPRRVHEIQQLEGKEMTYFNVLFRLSLLESHHFLESCTALLCSGKVPVYLPREDSLNRLLTPSLRGLVQSRGKIHTPYVAMVYSHLYRVVYHLVESCPEATGEQLRKHANYEKMQIILEYLRDNYPRETSIREAAALCGFSESHFMRLFRELTGTSFAQYVRLQRLSRAAELLRTTGKRVSEIAEEVGFHNLSYFTRAFAEKYHMPPKDYRAAWRKQDGAT